MSNLLLAAAVMCFPSADLHQWLAGEHQESVAAYGVTTSGLMAKAYSNPETQSWTITMSGTNGQSCILESGYGWRDIDGIVAVPEDEEVIQ